MDINRNSQTTSTKCQYHALASKPKWCSEVKWALACRTVITRINVVPIKTCRPWNPVAIKNVLPYTLSDMENEDIAYSMAWRAIKYTPSTTVITSLLIASNQCSSIIAMCAQVIVAPLDSKIVVFRRGTSNGLIVEIPVGGHTLPTSILGLKEEWKKAQKKAKKKNTSEEINNTMPIRRPFSTLSVCAPRWVPSRVTSRHHKYMVIRVRTNPRRMRLASYLCIQEAIPPTRHSLPIEPVRGQGLISTRWNGWWMSAWGNNSSCVLTSIKSFSIFFCLSPQREVSFAFQFLNMFLSTGECPGLYGGIGNKTFYTVPASRAKLNSPLRVVFLKVELRSIRA